MTVFSYHSGKMSNRFDSMHYKISLNTKNNSYFCINTDDLASASARAVGYTCGAHFSAAAATGLSGGCLFVIAQLVHDVGIHVIKMLPIHTSSTGVRIKFALELSLEIGSIVFACGVLGISLKSYLILAYTAEFVDYVVFLVYLVYLALNQDLFAPVDKFIHSPSKKFLWMLFARREMTLGFEILSIMNCFLKAFGFSRTSIDFVRELGSGLNRVQKLAILTGMISQEELDELLKQGIKGGLFIEELSSLIEAGANVNANNHYCAGLNGAETVFHTAVKYAHESDVLDLLIKKGVTLEKVHETTRGDRPLLMLAAIRARYLDMPRLYLSEVDCIRKLFLLGEDISSIRRLNQSPYEYERKACRKITDVFNRMLVESSISSILMGLHDRLGENSSVLRAYNLSHGHQALLSCLKYRVFPMVFGSREDVVS